MTCRGSTPPPARLVDYLRLVRLPNVFTAMADVTMGFVFAQGALEPLEVFMCLVAASSLLYSAGMVLNDVFDAAIDLSERPHRPIPSGRIPIARARSLGCCLVLAGAATGWLAGFAGAPVGAAVWRSGAVASLLGLVIVLYDGFLKATRLGPVAMGICRLLNVLLGMSVAEPVSVSGAWHLGGYGFDQWIPAFGIGVYAAGITAFARTEAATSRRGRLAAGAAVMMAGVLILASVGAPGAQWTAAGADHHGGWWLALMAVLALTILRRCARAMAVPSPSNVQMAVKHAILSIILLDAAVTLRVGPWYYGLGILTLLVPALVLGRWIEST